MVDGVSFNNRPPAPSGSKPVNSVSVPVNRPAEVRAESTPVGSLASDKQAEDAVQLLNRALQDRNLSVEFSTDEATRRQVVKLIDKNTGEVQMQLPSEAALSAAEKLSSLRGVFFDSVI